MSAKSNKVRYRRLRSAILSGSILSFLPLLVLMRSATGGTTTATTLPAPAVVSARSASAPSATAGAPSTTAPSSTPAQAPMTYTQTRAS